MFKNSFGIGFTISAFIGSNAFQLNKRGTNIDRMKKKIETFFCDTIFGIKMITELAKSTSCVGVEERNYLYRKEALEVWHKQFSTANEERVNTLPLLQKPCNDQVQALPDRHLMSTT